MIRRFIESLRDRIWWDGRENNGHWWNRALGIPFIAGVDESGRLVMLWGFGLIGFVAIAYWTCYCEDCVDLRAQWQILRQHQVLTAQYGEEFADEVRDRQLRLREMQGDGTPRV